MRVPKRVNTIRQKVMRGLTKGVGKSNFGKGKIVESAEISRILINRPNQRLGNLLMVTPLLQELEARFPNAKVDVFVKGMLAPIVFKGYENVDRTIRLPKKPFKEKLAYTKVWFTIRSRKYDLVINIDKSSSSGRLATKFSNSKFKFFGDLPDGLTIGERHMAKYPVVYLRECLKQLGMKLEEEKIPNLDLRLNAEELKRGAEILAELRDDKKKAIAIFTFATSTKKHSVEWWEDFYTKLKTAFPEHFIFEILPAENVSQIDFKATSFYSNDVREIGAVMANCDVFVGADSGIMHLASASGVKTIGLFNVTDSSKYEPYNSGSVAVDTNVVSSDEIVELVRERL